MTHYYSFEFGEKRVPIEAQYGEITPTGSSFRSPSTSISSEFLTPSVYEIEDASDENDIAELWFNDQCDEDPEFPKIFNFVTGKKMTVANIKDYLSSLGESILGKSHFKKEDWVKLAKPFLLQEDVNEESDEFFNSPPRPNLSVLEDQGSSIDNITPSSNNILSSYSSERSCNTKLVPHLKCYTFAPSKEGMREENNADEVVRYMDEGESDEDRKFVQIIREKASVEVPIALKVIRKKLVITRKYKNYKLLIF
jgi:hypothetical protein